MERTSLGLNGPKEGTVDSLENNAREIPDGRKTDTQPLLEVRGLSVSFVRYGRGMRRNVIRPVFDLHLDVWPGEVVTVIGSSGSGKSLLAHAILGILPRNAIVEGEILFRGTRQTDESLRRLRGRHIGLVPQSVNFLDPLMKVGKQLSGRKGGRSVEIFGRVGMPEWARKLYPFQLSGGMARRVLFVAALSGEPELIVADEPTPGLHPEVAGEVTRVLRELADIGKGVLLITHDVDLGLGVADRVAVFYAGTTLELAPASDFQGDGHYLRHPYSRDLWLALPANQFRPIPGSQPSPYVEIKGCPYSPRCAIADSLCVSARPTFRSLRGGLVRCHHAT